MVLCVKMRLFMCGFCVRLDFVGSYSSRTTSMTLSTVAGSTAWARVLLRLRTASPTRHKKKPTISTDFRRTMHLFLIPQSRADTGFLYFFLHPSTTLMLEWWRNMTKPLKKPVLLLHPVQTKTNRYPTPALLRSGDHSSSSSSFLLDILFVCFTALNNWKNIF